jgi:hypothetical protein
MDGVFTHNVQSTEPCAYCHQAACATTGLSVGSDYVLSC